MGFVLKRKNKLTPIVSSTRKTLSNRAIMNTSGRTVSFTYDHIIKELENMKEEELELKLVTRSSKQLIFRIAQ